jgi:hypothetical protein
MSNKSIATVATIGIDLGKNSFRVVELDQRGAIVLRQKLSRGQIEARLANMPPCPEAQSLVHIRLANMQSAIFQITPTASSHSAIPIR